MIRSTIVCPYFKDFKVLHVVPDINGRPGWRPGHRYLEVWRYQEVWWSCVLVEEEKLGQVMPHPLIMRSAIAY